MNETSRENRPKIPKSVFENRTAETEFSVFLNFEVRSVSFGF